MEIYFKSTKYLELNKRQTKTRTGANVADVTEVSPKIYEIKGIIIKLSIMKYINQRGNKV